MQLRVVQKDVIATDTVRIRLASDNRGALPPFRPGAHIELALPGHSRRYSLTSSPGESGFYEICVLRAHPSRGGSSFIHDTLAVGDDVEVGGPFSAFSVAAEAKHSVFIAGGIGITPFLTMIEEVAARGESFELHYSARDATRFLPTPIADGRITRYTDGPSGPTLNLQSLLASARKDSHIYVCGPQPMIEAVREVARIAGWPAQRVHFESFGASPKATDKPISLHLQRSGLTLSVQPGTSILDALLENGVWATYECRRGECGSCLTNVIAGEPSHRDVCLTEAQRSAGMCTCVSWAKTQDLVLDL